MICSDAETISQPHPNCVTLLTLHLEQELELETLQSAMARPHHLAFLPLIPIIVRHETSASLIAGLSCARCLVDERDDGCRHTSGEGACYQDYSRSDDGLV